MVKEYAWILMSTKPRVIDLLNKSLLILYRYYNINITIVTCETVTLYIYTYEDKWCCILNIGVDKISQWREMGKTSLYALNQHHHGLT